MIKAILTFVLIYFAVPALGVVVNVEQVSGKAYITGNVSPNEAKQEALNAAKKEALRKAGVAENISSTSALSTFEAGNSFNQYFSEHALIELSGVIKNYEIVSELMEVRDSLLIEYTIVINAGILIDYSQDDPTFSTDVLGLQSVYKNGSALKFEAHATQNCYLYVFHKTQTGLSLLTPNELELETGIMSNTPQLYPRGSVSYQLNANEPEEQHLVFVFLKKKQLLNKNLVLHPMTEAAFFKWVYQFEKNERRIKGYNFWIVK